MAETPFNLFSAPSRAPKKPLKTPPETTPLLAKNALSRDLPSHGKDLKDGEVEQLISEMKKMNEELNKKIDSAFKTSGTDPREMSEYVNNPKNFTPAQWEEMQARKEQLEINLSGTSKSEVRAKQAKKEVSKMTKERKGKTLGSRKNWLSMR